MPLRSKSFEKITLSDLQSLVDNEVLESKYIEYKQSLPGNADAEKREFLRDVSSFANAAGGDLIYGIREEDRIPAEVCGVDIQDIDGARLRLEDIIRYGIEPRIPGVVIHPIVEGERKVILVRVPKSWTSPHVVKFKEWKFYTRDSSGKHSLDVGELKSAFLLSETVVERTRNFRATRLGMIVSEETPVPLLKTPKVVLHVVPFGAHDLGNTIDLSTVSKYSITMCTGLFGGHRQRFNFDGYLSHSEGMEPGISESYLQIFRNGSLEGVDTSLLRSDSSDPAWIPSIAFEEDLIRSFRACMSLAKALAVTPPLFVMLSMLGVRGYRMAVGIGRGVRQVGIIQIEKNDLLIPEIVVDDFNLPADTVLKPIFDAVWNACGYPGSMNYDEDGNWGRPR